jgi:spoIIIJ-associated protein
MVSPKGYRKDRSFGCMIDLWLMNTQSATATINELLRELLRTSGLNLIYSIAQQPRDAAGLDVEFRGPDVTVLVARNGELLLALEHIATQALRLEPEQHDLIRFEAGGFKAGREHRLQVAAAAAVASVRRTGRSYAFQPMSSHERRQLHLALASSGLLTASEGEGAMRHLVLHPKTKS